jgi:hypothetical protein
MHRFLSANLVLFLSGVAWAQNLEAQVRIGQQEETISRKNLVKIKEFILKQGKRETYCNMFNNNPAHRTKNYHFYLNPDTGQENVECDPAKSDFNSLTIRDPEGGKVQYRSVEFAGKGDIVVRAEWPPDDLTIGQLRGMVVEALKEMLSQIK